MVIPKHLEPGRALLITENDMSELCSVEKDYSDKRLPEEADIVIAELKNI